MKTTLVLIAALALSSPAFAAKDFRVPVPTPKPPVTKTGVDYGKSGTKAPISGRADKRQNGNTGSKSAARGADSRS